MGIRPPFWTGRIELCRPIDQQSCHCFEIFSTHLSCWGWKTNSARIYQLGCQLALSMIIFLLVCDSLCIYGSAMWRLYLGMSMGKATAPSAAEMLSTMEVRARMFPCSGESAVLSRSVKKRGPVTHSASKQRGTWCYFLVISVWSVLTLAAVALCALFGSAAPLRATAAGAAWTGLAWWRHLWPWRCTSRRCCHSLCHDAAHPTPPKTHSTH